MTSPSTGVAGDSQRLTALGTPLRRHPALTHLAIVATILAVVVGLALPAAPIIQASLQPVPRQGTILPASVGVGVAATAPVVLSFPGPMDRSSVEAALGLAPGTGVRLRWSADATTLTLAPRTRWATDQRYVIHVPAGTLMADGGALAADWRATFTTQTASVVSRVQVTQVPGTATADTPLVLQDIMASAGYPESGVSAVSDDLAADASADPAIGLTFSAAMDQASVERQFRLIPAMAGAFRWEGTTLWFTPVERLDPGTRYAVTVAGARDQAGNRLGGDVSFSFTTRAVARVLTVTPGIGASGASGRTVSITFSLPMDPQPTGAAFRLIDTATGAVVPGSVGWDAAGRSLTFTAASALASGRTYAAHLGAGARDADGNPVAFGWRFTTAGAARVFVPGPAARGSSGSVQYALDQLNAARASYGLAPLVLDPAISAVAYAHAAEQLAYGYFSHDSLDGTTYRQRLTDAGISYGWSGENQCWLTSGGGVNATLDWCHAQFWAEPYPATANHKTNILSTNFRRVGIGIATSGGKVIAVWDFTD